jgi:hypothetical protein
MADSNISHGLAESHQRLTVDTPKAPSAKTGRGYGPVQTDYGSVPPGYLGHALCGDRDPGVSWSGRWSDILRAVNGAASHAWGIPAKFRCCW